MKLRRTIRVLGAIGLLAALGFAFYLWEEAHLWPFATGTTDEAFLGVTFGMSQPEARRALRKHGAQLVSYDDYKRISAASLIVPFNFDPYLFSDEQNSFSMYMPSIEMFGAATEAEFEFTNSRLAYVAVHFGQFVKPDSVIPSIVSALEARYKLSSREESTTIPGAYSLRFVSENVHADLWVNLTDTKKPNVVLSINRTSDSLERKKRVQERERAAFGKK